MPSGLLGGILFCCLSLQQPWHSYVGMCVGGNLWLRILLYELCCMESISGFAHVILRACGEIFIAFLKTLHLFSLFLHAFRPKSVRQTYWQDR